MDLDLRSFTGENFGLKRPFGLRQIFSLTIWTQKKYASEGFYSRKTVHRRFESNWMKLSRNSLENEVEYSPSCLQLSTTEYNVYFS